jgi:SAM-dependent methyltransferase
MTDPWADRSFLRDVQYRTDANLAARQSIYSYQEPRIDLQRRVIDLAAPAAGETVCDVGAATGLYLAELARRGFAGRVLGLDLSPGMLAAARERLDAVGSDGRNAAAEGVVLPEVSSSPSSTVPITSGSSAQSLLRRVATKSGDSRSACGWTAARLLRGAISLR